jgi:hypothetical protein
MTNQTAETGLRVPGLIVPRQHIRDGSLTIPQCDRQFNK